MMVIHLLKIPRGVNYYEDVLLFDISLMNKDQIMDSYLLKRTSLFGS